MDMKAVAAGLGRHSRSVAVAKHAFHVFGGLSEESSLGQLAAVRGGVIAAILGTMAEWNDAEQPKDVAAEAHAGRVLEILKWGSWALFHLTFQSPVCKNEASEQDGVRVLVAALSRPEADQESTGGMITQAMGVLANLVVNDSDATSDPSDDNDPATFVKNLDTFQSEGGLAALSTILTAHPGLLVVGSLGKMIVANCERLNMSRNTYQRPPPKLEEVADMEQD